MQDLKEISGQVPWAIQSVPPFPPLALQLLTLLDDERAPKEQILRLVGGDPALVAEVLRAVNSAHFSTFRQVGNLGVAISLMGTEAVKRLALLLILKRLSHALRKEKSLWVCWEHSIACGLIAEHLATVLDRPRGRAYAGGLLHDVGRLALAGSYPKEYAELLLVARERGFDELQCERELFDIDHCAAGGCAAGGWLANRWNLPPDLFEAIALHHFWEVKGHSLASIVASACRLANALGFRVLPMRTPQTVEEIVRSLPIPRSDGLPERLESLSDNIQTEIQTLTGSGTGGSCL